MSNTLIQGGVSALGEIPIWTLPQLFSRFIGRFLSHRNVVVQRRWWGRLLANCEGGGWKGLLNDGGGEQGGGGGGLERFARRCVLLKTTRTLPIDCVVIRAIRELKKGNIYSFRLCGQIPPKVLI